MAAVACGDGMGYRTAAAVAGGAAGDGGCGAAACDSGVGSLTAVFCQMVLLVLVLLLLLLLLWQ